MTARCTAPERHVPVVRRRLRWCVSAVLLAAAMMHPARAAASGQAEGLELRKGDTIVLVGNTLAERMQHFNHFETLLMARYPDMELRVRNLGWSGDTITIQPRPLNFGDTANHLTEQKADVILAFFGLGESFAGPGGVPQFEQDLDLYLGTHAAARYNGRTPPRVVLISPIAHESLPHLAHVDAAKRNRDLELYTEAMRRVAARRRVPFVDLFTPTKRAMAEAASPLTTNGVHLNETGDRIVAVLLMQGLGLHDESTPTATGHVLGRLETLRELIRQKNEQFFYRFRPLNAEYVVGRRVEPFGSVSFPPEMRQLDEIVTDFDHRVWKAARGIGVVRYPGLPGSRQ